MIERGRKLPDKFISKIIHKSFLPSRKQISSYKYRYQCIFVRHYQQQSTFKSFSCKGREAGGGGDGGHDTFDLLFWSANILINSGRSNVYKRLTWIVPNQAFQSLSSCIPLFKLMNIKIFTAHPSLQRQRTNRGWWIRHQEILHTWPTDPFARTDFILPKTLFKPASKMKNLVPYKNLIHGLKEQKKIITASATPSTCTVSKQRPQT